MNRMMQRNIFFFKDCDAGYYYDRQTERCVRHCKLIHCIGFRGLDGRSDFLDFIDLFKRKVQYRNIKQIPKFKMQHLWIFSLLRNS